MGLLADLAAAKTVDAVTGSTIIEVTTPAGVVKFTQLTIESNSSLVRRELARAGWSHDLEIGTTKQMLSHAICTRILEQL